MIRENKVELIHCLMADPSFILQHVQSKSIITDRQYNYAMHVSQPEQAVTYLIDQVMSEGADTCSLFIEVLKNPQVVKTYPQLRQITEKTK